MNRILIDSFNFFKGFPASIGGFFEGLLDTVIPALCPVCKENPAGERGFCSDCISAFLRVDHPYCISCGEPFVSKEVVEHRCKWCMVKPPYFRKARSFALYDGLLLDAIHRFKYNSKTSLASPFASLMLMTEIDISSYDAVLPVPIHKKRLRERGFNQSLLLGRRLVRHGSGRVYPMTLKKKTISLPQVGLTRKERIKNVRGTFRVVRPCDVKGKRVLLVDDVMTTGATVNECSKVLKRAGAEFVDVITIARTAKSGFKRSLPFS